jgi:hypothetical protein
VARLQRHRATLGPQRRKILSEEKAKLKFKKKNIFFPRKSAELFFVCDLCFITLRRQEAKLKFSSMHF